MISMLIFVLSMACLVLLTKIFTGRCNKCDGQLTQYGWCNTCRKRRPM